MNSGGRTGGGCVAQETQIWLEGEVKPVNITQVPVVWDDVTRTWSNDPVTPIKSPFSNKLVYPIWRLGGTERNPMVQIPVDYKNGYSLTATEWHPIVIPGTNGGNKIVPADFLQHNVNVFVRDEASSKISTGTTNQPNNQYRPTYAPNFPTVYNLGVASEAFYNLYKADEGEKDFLERFPRDGGDDEEYNYSSRPSLRYEIELFDSVIKNFLSNRLGSIVDNHIGSISVYNPLDLDLDDHIIFTGGLATGTSTLQYLLVRKLAEGLELGALQSLVNVTYL